MNNFTTPLFETAPYATFGILLLMVVSIAYLRSLILSYTEKNRPHQFAEFKLHEEQQEDTASQALYNYITTQSFAHTKDPILIGMCQRYIRWGQLFILFFVVAIVDIGFIYHAF